MLWLRVERFGRKGELALQTFATKMRTEGERIGIEKGEQNIILRMLERGDLTPTEIASLVGQPLSEIQRIDEDRQAK